MLNGERAQDASRRYRTGTVLLVATRERHPTAPGEGNDAESRTGRRPRADGYAAEPRRERRVNGGRRTFERITLSVIAMAMTVLLAFAQDPPYTVRWVGAQRDLMRGDLTARISLDSLMGSTDVYAVGPLEQLQGEITIWDGQPSIARVRDKQIVIDRTFNHRAPFLVWTQVSRWRRIPLPMVNDVAGLENAVRFAVQNARLDVNQPFPFLITSLTERISFHVLDKRDGLPHTPELHERAKVRFTREGAQVEIVGFYSDKHEGIFIPHGRVVHMHVRTPEQSMSGHVDDIQITADARLHLPRVP
jgi:acetolactate decarboxylase